MTARSEEAKAELREAEKKLADAKKELKEAEQKLADAKKELKEAETQQGQVEQKLMETKQADPANTAEIRRLEEKLQRMKQELQGFIDAVRELGLSVISKSASVRSKEEVIRQLESQLLPAIADPALALAGGELNTQSETDLVATPTLDPSPVLTFSFLSLALSSAHSWHSWWCGPLFIAADSLLPVRRYRMAPRSSCLRVGCVPHLRQEPAQDEGAQALLRGHKRVR